MFQWLLLTENTLTAAENNVWKESALRIILVSGFLLEIGIGVLSGWQALQLGHYYILALDGLFFVLLGTAIYYSVRRPVLGSALLIATIYAAAFCIAYFITDQKIARLGLMFVYTAPLIGRMFFGPRVALLLMGINVFPFWLILRQEALPTYPGLGPPLDDAHGYIQSLLFLFFNICVPLGVFRLLHALDASIIRHSKSSKDLLASHAQYQEIFENAGGAILLCDTQGTILKANSQANTLIGRSAGDTRRLTELLRSETGTSEAKPVTPVAPDFASLVPGQELSTSAGKLVTIDRITSASDNHCIVLLRDMSNMRQMQDALERSTQRVSFLRSHDHLTNLPNRSMLKRHLDEVLPTLRPERRLALVTLRLDSIKYINDAHGMATGDALIKSFAEALAAQVPASGFCTRLRSVVFCFLLDSDADSLDAVTQAEYICSQLPKEIAVDGELHQVRLSVAIAFSRHDDASSDDLIQRGKVANDSARQSGGQQVSVFDETAAARIRRKLSIEQAIVAALKAREFRLVFQPKVDHDAAIVGLEALIRWRSSLLGEVSPAEFIPIAEGSGTIRQITAFVVDQVCVHIRQITNLQGSCLPVAINLSAIDVVREDLLMLVNASCQRHGVAPECLEFEITETGLIGNENLAIQHLEALRAKGFGITIDDFGTGYSSLSKLSRFPTKSIKIDQSFVAQIGRNEKSELIIRAVVSLAAILSCTTVAEGVETREQEVFLKAIGCGFFQGFYYYRPMEFESVVALLRANSSGT